MIRRQLLWVCDCGESLWSPVLAVDDWNGHPQPIGPDCPACGGVMEAVPAPEGEATEPGIVGN